MRTAPTFAVGFFGAADRVLALARSLEIRHAMLKVGRSSCGTQSIHYGGFSGVRTAGLSVAAILLVQAGIQVFNETALGEADAVMRKLDAGARS